MKPLLLNAEPADYSPAARARLETAARVRERDCDRAALLREVAEAEILIVRLRHRVDEAVLAAAPRLRHVVSATTGLDHIDLDACARRGVRVHSLRGEVEFLRAVTATAELTWGLLLAVLRHLPEACAHVRGGGWDRDLFRGLSLSGRTLGIVGLGRLGEHVARYGQAFGMTVLAHDPHREALPAGVTRLDLSALLAASDVVSLHVPLNPSTEKLIGPAEFAAMKPGAILLNTARGEVVDESALLDALRSGRLAGAGLDVLAGEGGKTDGWLERNPVWQHARQHPNVVITPHIGGAARDAMERTEIFMAEKLLRALSATESTPS